MKDVALYTNVGPKERIKKLYNFIDRFLNEQNVNNYNYLNIYKSTLFYFLIIQSVELTRKWNLNIEKDLIKVESRVLPLETLCSNDQQYNGGSNADWTNNIWKYKMFKSVVFSNWVVLTPERHIADVNKFLITIKKSADSLSFNLPRPHL